MEIVLKTKQAGNPQFGFLNYDHYLNKYYKLILRKIKDDGYIPILEGSKEDTKKDATESSETEGIYDYYPSERAKCDINKITDSYWPKTFEKGLYSPV